MKAFACALVLLGFALPATAAAAESESSPLSPELTQLAQPAVAAQPTAAQAEAAGLPAEGPGSIVREGDRVIVEARFDEGALARLEALEAAGAKVLTASRRYQTVALSVTPEDLGAVAAVPGLATVAASREPVFYGADETLNTVAASKGLCEGGSVITQGLQQLNVPAARAAFGARGAGETIGVISDSFNSATTSIEGGPLASDAHGDEVSNDLPGPASTCSGQQVPVRVLAEAPAPGPEEEPRTDEGRAMLQVIHDLAPHAQLAFATAYSTEFGFARNIERLAEPVVAGGGGANVIVDDVGYSTEPFFQNGPVAVAIKKVTEAGVIYLTAAGNDNLFEGKNEIASWEAPAFRNAGSCPAAVDTLMEEEIKAGTFEPECMDFNPAAAVDTTFGLTVEAGRELNVDLQWAEPWYGVKTDLDAFLLNEAGTVIATGSPSDNVGKESFPEPVELVEWENTSTKAAKVQLVINRCVGSCNPEASTTRTPRLKFAFLEDGRGVSATEYPKTEEVGGVKDVVGPTIYGHAGSAAAITLGAVRYTESASAPKEPERYSSRGPVTHYFDPVVGTTPAAELTTPEELRKPNVTATDCASTTFFAQIEAGVYHFCGTSEAGPHAAAIAALMKQTDPLASPAAIEVAMESSATAFTSVTSLNAVGKGMVNAAAAITALGGSRVEDPPSSVVAALEGETAAAVVTPAPVVRITNGPKALGNESRPTFEFGSTRPVSFTCQIDGGAARPCASPYVVPTKLADGSHGFVVTGTDAEGLSGTSSVYEFTIDTKAPRTTIVVHPKKVIKTRQRSVVGRFRVRADEAPVTFYCQFDKEALRICGKTFHRRFTPGVHVVKVRAMDALGNLAAGWTRYKFRVKQVGP